MKKSYLIFSWQGLRYGIEASLVQEVFLLPELAAAVEAPRDIVGILNLRSTIIPIMHLDLRLGLPMQECQINDSIIVFAWEGLQMGVITHKGQEVRELEVETLESGIDYGRVSKIDSAFVAGMAKIDGDFVVLLNPETLVRYSEEVKALVDRLNDSEAEEVDSDLDATDLDGDQDFSSDKTAALRTSEQIVWDFYQLCYPNPTPEEKEMLRERAEELKAVDIVDDSLKQTSLAVVEMNGEYYGLDLSVVREFIDVDKISSVPCTPNHIVGNINLRGEVVTLVDIRQVLNLPLVNASNIAKAVVVKIDGLVAGLPVDKIFDVEYFRSSEIESVPAAVAAVETAFIRGTIPYSEKMLSIVDITKMLSQGGLEINEEV